MPRTTDTGHLWVAAVTVGIPLTQVRMAHNRGTYRVKADTKVAVEDVYCSACRLRYRLAEGKPCSARESREHLIGGPGNDTPKPLLRVANG